MEAYPNKSVLLVLLLGVFMGALDISIVGPALPALKRLFLVSERSSAWVFSIYILLYLIGTPLMARLSDTFGRRRMFVADTALFAAGSLVVALAPAFPLVLVGRALQGLGAGGIFPVATAIVGETFPRERRGSALGVIGAVYGLAFIVGPLLGGLLLIASWRLLFLVNIPVAFVIIVMSMRALPASPSPAALRFDMRGMISLALVLTALASGISRIDTIRLLESLTSHEVFPYLLFAIAGGMLFTEFEQRKEHPLIRLDLLKNPAAAAAVVIALGSGVCEAGLVFIPGAAVTAYGMGESAASLVLLPLVAAMAIASPLAGRALDLVGARYVMLAGTALIAAGLLLFGAFTRHLAALVAAEVLAGAGFAALPMRFIMLDVVPEGERTSAQGIVSMGLSVGQMLGGVMVGAVIASYRGSVQGYGIAYLSLAVVALAQHGAAYAVRGKTRETGGEP